MDQHTEFMGTPARYGNACANCSQSKTKCILRRKGESCDRCRRLNKECRPAETIRRRGHRKPALSKSARLEEKFDSLVSLIKGGSQAGAVVASSHSSSTIEESTVQPQVTVHRLINTETHNQTEHGSVLSSSNDGIHSAPVSTPATAASRDSSDRVDDPSPAEAEEYLTAFRTWKSTFFPFVHILPTITAQQLRQERPFLWLCIMAIGAKSTSQQKLLASKVRQAITQKMVFQSESNIDLLLGLLSFIGWAQYQIQSKPFLSLFTQLAISLVFELRLNKPIMIDRQEVLPCIKQHLIKPLTPRTTEERRAVLGCFLMSSTISSFLQKIDALRWTTHMDECLQVLDEGKECLNDEMLVQQVRLRLVAERRNLSGSSDGAAEFIDHKEATSSHSEALSEMEDLRTKILANPQTNEVVLLHLYSTELEITLSPSFLHTTEETYHQSPIVSASLAATKSWFVIFFRIPPTAYLDLPFSIISQLLRCVLTLCRLTGLADPNRPMWDENSISETAESLSILDHAINNLEQAAMFSRIPTTDCPQVEALVRCAQIFRSLRSGLDARSDNLSNFPQTVDDAFLPDDLGVDFFENDWLMDILLSPNYLSNS